MSGKVMAIEPTDLWKEAQALRGQANDLEAEAVRGTLALVNGNVRQAADLLGVPHRTLDTMIRGGRLKGLQSLTQRRPGRPPTPKVAEAKPAIAKLPKKKS